MKLIEHKWEELSNLTVRYYTCAFRYTSDSPDTSVLIVAFEGAWTDPDGRFMLATCNAAVEYWLPSALVIDLRVTTYDWGDEMGLIFNAGASRWVDDTPFPKAMVISDLNREGLKSLVRDEMGVEPESLLFESVEDAIGAVEAALTWQSAR